MPGAFSSTWSTRLTARSSRVLVLKKASRLSSVVWFRSNFIQVQPLIVQFSVGPVVRSVAARSLVAIVAFAFGEAVSVDSFPAPTIHTITPIITLGITYIKV